MNGNDTDTFIEWMCPENPENLKQLEADARMAGVPVVRKSAQNLICFFMNLFHAPDRESQDQRISFAESEDGS